MDLSVSYFILYLLTWVVFWAFYLFYKDKANYITGFIKTIVFYISLSLLARLIFAKLFFKFDPSVSLVSLFIFIVFGVVTVLIHFLVTRHIPEKKTSTHITFSKHNTASTATVGFPYLFSVTCDILFQQTMVIIFLLLLRAIGLTKETTIAWFVIVFTLIHVIYYSRLHQKHSLSFSEVIRFSSASCIGAFIMGFFILQIQSGFIYSLILQSGYRTLLGIIGKKKAS